MAKKDTAQLDRIYKALGDRLDFTLKKLVEEGKPIAPALATAASNYLKLHKVGEQITKDADEESAQQAQVNFVPRISVEPSPWSEEDAERARVNDERAALGIKPVTLSATEQRDWDNLNKTTTKEEESF